MKQSPTPCGGLRAPLAALSLAALLLAPGGAARAAAGMWPLDQLPEQALAQHGLKPDVARLMQASVRLPQGSASFVSPRGLLLTNHHVVSECIAALSSPDRPLLQRGFVAAQPRLERRCPGMEAEQLQGIDTLAGELPDDPAARKQQLQRWTGADCPRAQRCEAVLLHGGARVQRYRYRVFDDVRLAFAPEAQAANFGGDDDNFNYPRFAFDFALLRVYSGGRPLRSAPWLRPARRAPRLGDAVMVSGHPYETQRLLTVAQLEAERDQRLPTRIARLAAERAALAAYAARSPEAARQSADPLATLDNSLKALHGELRALRDPALLQAKRSSEAQVRAATPDARPWEQAARSAQAAGRLAARDAAQRLPAASLLDLLLQLLTQREENRLPAAERLAAHAEPAAAALRQRAAADTPRHPELEAALLAAHLAHARQVLGAQDEWVRAWPDAADLEATLSAWLRLSRLQQPAERLRLLDAEPPSDEPLLQLAQRLLPLHRALAREQEREVEHPLLGASAALARARWQVLGTAEAPDAGFTLRLSFGRVAEQTGAGQRQPWQTNLGGLLARADAFGQQPPFDLSPRLAAVRRQLEPRTPLNFIASADIVGGNSGSPVLDAAGDWIGVAFDGNLESLAGSYHFDEASNRMVVLHQQAIGVALRQVYPAARPLAKELGL